MKLRLILLLAIFLPGYNATSQNAFWESLSIESLEKKGQNSLQSGVRISLPNGGYVLSGELISIARSHVNSFQKVPNADLLDLLDHKDPHVRYTAFACLKGRAAKRGIKLKYYPLQDPKTEANLNFLQNIKVLLPAFDQPSSEK